MKVINADLTMLPELYGFYRNVIDKTADMQKYAGWKWGLHPTERIIRDYTEEGFMYLLTDGAKIAGAMAVSTAQDAGYHDIEWGVRAADDEVDVIHILAVSPEYHGTGAGKHMLDEAIRLAEASGKKAVRLDALASNAPAHYIYLKKGFVYRGKKNLYADNTGWADFFFFELIL